MACRTLDLLWVLSLWSVAGSSELQCEELKKSELFPWLIELELKSADQKRVFSGDLISLRSLVTCCICTEPLNPNVTDVHRLMYADDETLMAKTVDRSDLKTFQVRFALQIIAEASCTIEEIREMHDIMKPALTFIAVVILDMAFFWEDTFYFPRMPFPTELDYIREAINDILGNDEDPCWCQTQHYTPVAKDFSSRIVKNQIHVVDLFFGNWSNSSSMQNTVITGTVKSGSSENIMLGSPLICNGTVLGLLSVLERDRKRMTFIRLDVASVFMSEFLLLDRYFPRRKTSEYDGNSSPPRFSVALPPLILWYWWKLLAYRYNM